MHGNIRIVPHGKRYEVKKNESTQHATKSFYEPRVGTLEIAYSGHDALALVIVIDIVLVIVLNIYATTYDMTN